ncbi:PREDICTED: mevalonate kinase [Ceratosolen solmsi marchali]|uniref:Mevalonate kinase n=1 Tax=Ceratosolen solmsi marchali TaxID=326594 RepID=A0AAJ6YH35_9HYME|nr:PREDICTED: mevalonate kinase [Ceratosolen solmsi marchali]
MISFKISTPGKVILFGEHAVVFGKTAVAASLNRRTTLELVEFPSEDTWIRLEMQKLQVVKKISVKQVQESLLGKDFPKLCDDGHEKFYQRIQEFVETIGFENQRQKVSLECFFYALLQIVQYENLKLNPFRVTIDTELPIGAGVGSSAAFSVCLIAGFLHWSQLQRNINSPPEFDTSSLENISRYALNCEKIMHGTPSGIDNSICTFGSVIEFRKGETPTFIPLGLKSIRILLVDTKVDRSTKQLVNKLAGLTNKYPQIFHKVLDTIDEISRRVIHVVKGFQDSAENDQLIEAYKELSVLVNMNQGLLSTCQVSHSSLDLICMTANNYGFSAKLTGAGGGGFAYILIPPNASDVNVQDLSSELIKNGFSVIKTNLGGSGVEIHDAGIRSQD